MLTAVRQVVAGTNVTQIRDVQGVTALADTEGMGGVAGAWFGVQVCKRYEHLIVLTFVVLFLDWDLQSRCCKWQP